MAQGTYLPYAEHQFFTDAGVVAAGYQIFTYLAGTSTKASTYSDITLTTPNANPFVLPANGRMTIFCTTGQNLKLIMAPPTDTDPPSSPVFTRDNIQPIPGSGSATDNDIATAIAGETLTAGQAVYQSDGSGGKTASRWYKADATNTYSSVTANVLGFAVSAISLGATGTVRISGRITGLSGLVAGTLYYLDTTGGALTASAPTNSRAICQADTTTSAVISPWVPISNASATQAGLVGLVSQTLGTGVSSDVKTVGAIAVNSTPNWKPGSDAALDTYGGGVIRGSVDTTQHANSGVGNTVMSTMSLGAGALATNGAYAEFTFGGTFAANANNKIITFVFGATIVTLQNGGSNGGSWHATVYVVRTGAATQKIIAFMTARPGGVADANAFSTTAAETLSGAITVQTKSQSGTASSDILQEVFIPKIFG